MTQLAVFPPSLMPTSPVVVALSRPPAPQAPPKHRFVRRRRRCYYAIAATRSQIRIPAAGRLGYLTQSRLLQRAQAGDAEAHRLVWAANARLAYSVINRIRVRPDLMADAFQEVQIGLCRAIRRFEVHRLHEFSTYAFAAMRSFAIRHRNRVAHAVSLPAQRAAAYYRFRERLVAAPSRPQWFDTREEYLDRDPTEYQFLLALHRVASPSDIEAARGEAAPTLSPADAVLADDTLIALHSALRFLEERQRLVIARRFGLWGRPPETLDQIGPSLGLTKERVRQIQNRALAALRNRLQARGWSELPPSLDR